jgi:hypothetical protein
LGLNRGDILDFDISVQHGTAGNGSVWLIYSGNFYTITTPQRIYGGDGNALYMNVRISDLGATNNVVVLREQTQILSNGSISSSIAQSTNNTENTRAIYVWAGTNGVNSANGIIRFFKTNTL